MPEFYMIFALKIITIAEFLLYLPEILTKFPNILHDFCPKNARILRKNCPKKIFPEFYGAHVPVICAPPPFFYAYGIIRLSSE